MRIVNCKTGHLTNPIGFYLPKPVLTWCVEDAIGSVPDSARVIVSEKADMTNPLLDTGFCEDISSLGYPLSLNQKPRTRYYWTVSVRSDAKEEAISEIQWFETGKLEEPWVGKWIGCGGERLPIYEKKLPLKEEVPVAAARLYLCGLGLYEVSINGRKVGDEFLSPGCNNYDQWLQYQTYDITEILRSCGNRFAPALSVILGNGWYKGRFGFAKGGQENIFGDSWKLIAEVHVLYEDGSEDVIGTDESWTLQRSNITVSNIYDGENLDMTLPVVPSENAVFCESPGALLTARYSPAVTVYSELSASLLHTASGERVLDIGQNIAGIFRMHVHVPAGQIVRLQFGESLQDGNFYRENLRTAKAAYTFVSDGQERILQPEFTYYGYRYVKVEGIENIDPADFTALALTSSNEEICNLITGNEKVNQLLSNINWSRRDNFIDVPTDCPQRDERMGWTGDAQVFASTALYQTDAYAFYRKYLHDMATEQAQKNGMVPNVIPSCHIDGTSSVWGDAAAILPWTLYEFSGDQTILEEQYPSMKAWVNYISEVDGDHCGWRDVFHYGDWLALDRTGDAGATRGATDEDFIADIYYRYSVQLTAKAAAVLGRDQDAAAYSALASRLKNRILNEYYSPNGRCCVPTQTALLLTLRHGLADSDRTKTALQKRLESNGKLDTGFVGTPVLCDTLSEFGMGDLAKKLFLNEEYPGWLHEVNLGATTVWERWNSLDDQGHFSSTGMNSLNHYAYGSVAGWVYRHVAGLQPLQPGFQKARIAPEPIWELHTLSFVCRTAAGEYQILWKCEDINHLTVQVKIPFGASAEFVLPNASPETYEDRTNPVFADVQENVCHLSAGVYRVTYTTAVPLHTVMSCSNSLEELLADPKSHSVLMKIMPQITQLPEIMKGSSLAAVMERFGQGGMTAQIDELLKDS